MYIHVMAPPHNHENYTRQFRSLIHYDYSSKMSYYTTSLIAKSFPHSVKDEEEATTLYDRAQLDRKRLEEAFIKYSVLQISKHCPEQFRDIAFGSTVEETLKEITPLYSQQDTWVPNFTIVYK